MVPAYHRLFGLLLFPVSIRGLGQMLLLVLLIQRFINLAQSSSYANDFHDITTGNNSYYPAEPGFDDATGLGLLTALICTMIWLKIPWQRQSASAYRI